MIRSCSQFEYWLEYKKENKQAKITLSKTLLLFSSDFGVKLFKTKRKRTEYKRKVDHVIDMNVQTSLESGLLQQIEGQKEVGNAESCWKTL